MSNFKIFISDVFDIKSEYYEKMQELIKNPNPLNEKYTEVHHIIPRFVYRDAHIPIDDSETNKVSLSIKNHILIHYYAAKCCFKQYKWKCLNAVLMTLGNIPLHNFEEHLDEVAEQLADVKKLLRETPMPDDIRQKCSWDHHRFSDAERKEKFGKQAIGNTYRCGTKHSTAVCKKISENRKGKTLGHAVSEDTKIKIGNANRGRSCRHAPEVYKQVGKFTAHRMDVLKQKFSPSQTDWNTFQKKVKTLKEQIILEMSENKKLPKKIIRQNYKEDILSELLSRL